MRPAPGTGSEPPADPATHDLGIEHLVSARLASLSPAERRVARAMLADYPSATLGSAARLAERAAVSAPTVFRFAQTVGFDGFAGLQSAVRDELSARSDGPLHRLSRVPERGTSLDRLLRQAQAATDQTMHSLRAIPGASLEAAVALLADTDRRLLLHGGRFTQLLANYLAHHLEQLRPDVRVLDDPLGADLGEIIELSRRDVLVLFDFHRYQRSAVDVAERARRAGSAVLLISDDMSCPAAPGAEVVLIANSTVGSAYQSNAAAFLLTELLLPLTMDVLGDAGRTRMALWEQHRAEELLP